MVLMFLYAALVEAFFSLLWRSERKQRIKLFITIFCSLFLGGILLGWLMFPAPYK
jgi:hypothetical protein